MADKELEILSRLQTTLDQWTVGMSEVRTFISDNPPVTSLESVAPPVHIAPVESLPPQEDLIENNAESMFALEAAAKQNTEIQEKSDKLEAERFLQESLIDDSRKEIVHLKETVHNLGEEVRTLRLDAVREEETRLALEEDRNESRQAMEGLAQQLTESHAEMQRLKKSHLNVDHTAAVIEADLNYAREILVKATQTAAQADHQVSDLTLQRDDAVQTLGKLRLQYDELSINKDHKDILILETQQALAEQEQHLRETEERLQSVIQALDMEKEGRAQQHGAWENTRFGQLILQERIEHMMRAQDHDSTRESETSLQEELDALKKEMADYHIQSDIRVNLEIALRAEIESLRSVSVEKEFVLNYMQQEMDQINSSDLQEHDVLQKALDNTVRWREEVTHQARESREMQKLMYTLKSSLERKEAELDALKNRLDSISGHIADKGNDAEGNLHQHELELELEALRADNMMSFEVLTALKKELTPWLTKFLRNENLEVKESIPIEEPTVFDGVDKILTHNKSALDIPSLPLRNDTPESSLEPTVEDVELQKSLQINADIQQRVEQFYTRHSGARMIQWGRVLAVLNAIALLFWGWAVEFDFPQSLSQFNVFHIGFCISGLAVLAGCGMVLAGVKRRL